MKGPTQSMVSYESRAILPSLKRVLVDISFTVVLGATILGFQKHGRKFFSQNRNQRKEINWAESHGMHSRILTIYQIRQAHSFRPYVVQTYVPHFANSRSLSKTRRAAFG